MAKLHYKWWHGWIAGPLLGVGLWLGVPAVEGMGQQQIIVNVGAPEFNRLMLAAHVSAATANLSGFRIYPPENGKHYLTWWAPRQTPQGMVERQFEFTASTPFVAPPIMRFGESKTYPNVMEYLATVAPSVQYSYAWWAEPRVNAALWIGTPTVLFGVLLPIVMEILMRMGLVARPVKEEKAIPLPPVPDRKPEEAPQEGLTAEDQNLLDQALEKLSANVGDVPQGSSAAADAAAVNGPAKPAEVRVLTGGPVEAVAQQAGEETDFDGGVYYPVHRPKKKDDTAH